MSSYLYDACVLSSVLINEHFIETLTEHGRVLPHLPHVYDDGGGGRLTGGVLGEGDDRHREGAGVTREGGAGRDQPGPLTNAEQRGRRLQVVTHLAPPPGLHPPNPPRHTPLHVGVVHGEGKAGPAARPHKHAQFAHRAEWGHARVGRYHRQPVGVATSEWRRHHHQVDGGVARRQRQVSVVRGQGDVHPGPPRLHVGVRDRHAGDRVSHPDALRDAPAAVSGDKADVNERRVVVDVDDAHRHDGARLQALSAVVTGDHHQVIGLARLVVKATPHADLTGDRVH